MADAQVQDSLLVETSDERRELRERVAKLVGNYGRPYFQDVVRRGVQPDELWAEMGQAGFLGVHIATEFGGGGGGLADLAVAIEETASQGCPLFMLVISPAIAGSLVEAHGSPEMKRRWLPGIADGSRRISFAITEPEAGSNTHKIAATARSNGDGGWRLTGLKHWTGGADVADAILVVAKGAEPGPKGRHPLSLFVVPANAPGLKREPIDSALRVPERPFRLTFDDVPVGADGLIGAEGEGLRQVFAGLNPERVTAASMANGIARYALHRGAKYAAQRTVWSEPIGAHQGVAHPLAKAYIDVQLARLMTMRAAELSDAGADAAESANIAKYAAGEAVVQALDQAIQVHGANGFDNAHGLSDLWFVARMFRTAPVSREMILNFVAEHSLGLPKSY